MFGSNITSFEERVPIINAGVPLGSPPSYEDIFPLSKLMPAYDPAATSTSSFKAEPLAPTDVKSEIPWKKIALCTLFIASVILTAVSIHFLVPAVAPAAIIGLCIATGIGIFGIIMGGFACLLFWPRSTSTA